MFHNSRVSDSLVVEDDLLDSPRKLPVDMVMSERMIESGAMRRLTSLNLWSRGAGQLPPVVDTGYEVRQVVLRAYLTLQQLSGTSRFHSRPDKWFQGRVEETSIRLHKETTMGWVLVVGHLYISELSQE